VLEAGLGFAVKTKKPDFIGRDAVLRRREEGLGRRMVQFQLTDPEPMLFHNEALVRDGEIVSIVTSGNYGHASRRGHRHGLRAVPRRDRGRRSGFHLRDRSGRCERHAAKASLKPLYDPGALRVRM
jgi:glycine cleavage system aminomethyltransferase T